MIKVHCKPRLELWTPVTNDLGWHPMQSEHLIPKKGHHSLSGEGRRGRDGVHLLGEPIDHNEDGILVVQQGQRSDQIQRDSVPRTWEYAMGVQWGSR